MVFERQTDRVARDALRAIIPRLGEVERKEYFNFNYWRLVETLGDTVGWSGKRILDIGITPGHMAMALKHLGCHVFGITDDRLLQEMKGRWVTEKIDVRGAVIDKEPLPFPDDYFDGVLFTEVLEHLLYNPRKVVEEIYRVLRPGGELIVSTPNATRLGNRIKMLLGRNIYPRPEHFYFSDPYRRHNREYTMQELISLFKSEFYVRKARYILMWEFTTPVSSNGKVFDAYEYAEIEEPPKGPINFPRNFKQAAKLFLLLPKLVFPPFRSGLLVRFISSKRTSQKRDTA